MKNLCIGFLLLGLCGSNSNASEATIALTETQFRNIGVTLGKLEAADQIPVLNAPARVVVPPAHEYLVSAAQAGLVTRLSSAVGDSVKRGQALAVIDSPELIMLQQRYLQAVSESQLAQATYQRDKKLLDAGVIAVQRWQESVAQLGSKTSAENEARQLLTIAGMNDTDIKRLAATRRLSNQLVVRVPENGVVLEQMVKIGERVAVQAPLFRIANLQELWLEIAIPQQRAKEIKTGDLVTMENSAATAHIALLGQSVDPQNQTVLARAVIDGGKAQIRAGQTVNAQIVRPGSGPLFKVPNRALAIHADQAYVFKRIAGGFALIPVTIVGKQGETSYVSGALPIDDEFAVSGAVALKAKWMGLGEGEK